jgi:hypothetical protein
MFCIPRVAKVIIVVEFHGLASSNNDFLKVYAQTASETALLREAQHRLEAKWNEGIC